MELTAASFTRSRKARSLNIAFTSAWQSSKVPSMATACTLGSAAVVIMRRCTSETRPLREQHDGVDALGAAEGLDGRAAGVARGGADDGDALAAGSQHAVHQPRQQLHGHVLEGQRRPVEQLQHPQVAVDLDERGDGRVAEAGIGVAGDARAARPRGMASPTNGSSSDDGDLGEGLAGEAGDRLAARAWARSSARRARRRAPARPAARPRRTSSGASPLVLTYRKGEAFAACGGGLGSRAP